MRDSRLAASPTPEPLGEPVTAEHIWLRGIIHGTAHGAIFQTTEKSQPLLLTTHIGRAEPHHPPRVEEGWQQNRPQEGACAQGGGPAGWPVETWRVSVNKAGTGRARTNSWAC